jgi:DHA3 family macrolide efflux protein-like MFS transporter
MLILRPLHRRPVALLWGGLALSGIGDQLYFVALAWIAVGLIGADAGYLGALQAAAVLLVALIGGIWADGWDHRRTMIGADLVRALAVLVPVAATLAGPLTVWTLIPPALAVAGLRAFFEPALQASLPRIAGDPALLPATNALFDATQRIARLVGPMLAGLLSGLMPVIHLFTLDALSFLASAGAIAELRGVLPPRDRAEAAGPARASSRILLGSLGRALPALRQRQVMTYAVWSGGILNGLWYMTIFLGLPLIIAGHALSLFGGSGIEAYGLVMASYGLTNLAANLVIGSRPLLRPGRLIFTGNVVLGLGLASLGLADWLVPAGLLLPALMAAAGLTAIGGPMHDIPLATWLQTLFAPAEIAGVARLVMVANQAGLLIGMLAAPALFAALGTSLVTIGCGAGIAVIGLGGLWRFAASDATSRRVGFDASSSPPLCSAQQSEP